MGIKATDLLVFDDPACNPFLDPDNNAAVPVECMSTGATLDDIPASYAKEIRHRLSIADEIRNQSVEDFIKVPEPQGFSSKDYREREVSGAKSMERAIQPMGPVPAEGKSTVTKGGKPNTPRLTPAPLLGPSNENITVDGIIAANRFGLGALPGELSEASQDPKNWLKNQLTPQAVLLPYEMPKTHQCVRLRFEFLDNPAFADITQDAIDTLERVRSKNRTPGIPNIDDIVNDTDYISKALFHEIRIRDFIACSTRAPFAERLVRFWTNHFAVTSNANTATMVGDFERTVSRRHYLGKFSTILIASTLHPAMLHFLNNVDSVGPNSPFGVTIGNPPANENLAREVLELHSMGSLGGYSQVDVEEVAKALTGCITGVGFHGNELAGRFLFEPLLHEPGARFVLGKEYPENNDSLGQIIEILNDIARHPATVRRICTKLAEHFVSDTPPVQLIDNLVARWDATDGQLSEVYKALVDDPLSWSPTLEKFKVPNDLLNSAARALGSKHIYGEEADFAEYRLFLLYQDLGQFPYTPPTPEGWSDDAEDWAQPSPMMARMQWANQVAARIGVVRPDDFFLSSIGGEISDNTAFWTGGAASPAQGMTLSIMSPEFQRR